MRTERTAGVVRASGTMAVATLASRFTGFVAKVVVLAFLGAWIVSDS
jgi:putative peptidoglycan lipid II flippase